MQVVLSVLLARLRIVMFGEKIGKIFFTRLPVDEEYSLGYSIENTLETHVH